MIQHVHFAKPTHQTSLPQRITSRAEVSDDVIAEKEHFERERETPMQCSDDDHEESCRFCIRLQRGQVNPIEVIYTIRKRLTLERIGYTFAAR